MIHHVDSLHLDLIRASSLVIRCSAVEQPNNQFRLVLLHLDVDEHLRGVVFVHDGEGHYMSTDQDQVFDVKKGDGFGEGDDA